MSNYSFDAVIFDMDGVITKTALVHASAWKEMFDEYLRKREKLHKQPFKEFNQSSDYKAYVEGKPRYKGVASFLDSRGIKIPFGTFLDSTDAETICGLGNRKNELFNQILQRDGVGVYESTIALMDKLKKEGLKLGVVSMSQNCKQVLERANLLHYFDTRVDGVVMAELGLNEKPEHHIFTLACDNLKVPYTRAVVITDSVSGIQAGQKSNFGFVLGVARADNTQELQINGADMVVFDLQDIDGAKGIEKWFDQGLIRDLWSVSQNGYDVDKEQVCETLLAVGNGYFATLGALEEHEVEPITRPSTYMENLHYAIKSNLIQHSNKQDIENVPNWLPITFKVGEGEWFDPAKDKILYLERNLNFLNGVLFKKMVVQDSKGNKSLIESYRMASLANKHHAAIDYSITPLNYSGTIRIRSAIALPLQNKDIKKTDNKTEPIQQGGKDNLSYIAAKTIQSNKVNAVAAKLDVYYEDRPLATDFVIKQGNGWVNTYFKASVNKEKLFRLEKLVSLCNSFSGEIIDPLAFVIDDCKKLRTYGIMHAASINAWDMIWKKVDVRVPNDRLGQKEKRLMAYQNVIVTPQKE
jgi:beta-phosphoglucomutase family hydrolase